MAVIEKNVVQVNNLTNELELVFATTGHREYIPKIGGIRLKQKGNYVYMLLDSDVTTGVGANTIRLDYREITNPSSSSAAALRATLLSYIGTSVGGTADEVIEAQVYVGKVAGHNGDFNVARLDADTLSITSFPPGVTEIFSDDIEFVRQIAMDGTVTRQWDRNDVAITINADRITVAGAAFKTTDRFVVWTNINKDVGTIDNVQQYMPCWVGKTANQNGDFEVSRVDSDTLIFDTLPEGVTALYSEDIEAVRHMNSAGNVIAIYKKDFHSFVMVNKQLTVAGASFGATDTYTVFTNVHRHDIVPDVEFMPSYIGKPATGNGDFNVAYQDYRTISFATFPPGVTTIYAHDIEKIKVLDANGWAYKDITPDRYRFREVANGMQIDGNDVYDVVFQPTDQFIVYTNIARPSGGGGSADADFKIGSWDGTVTFATSTTLTLAGAYPTINNDAQIVYIRYVDGTNGDSDIFINGENGVTITHAGGTLTVAGAGTPFANTDTYEVGLNAVPPSLDLSLDATKVIEQAPQHARYIDPATLVTDAITGEFDFVWMDQGAEIDCRGYNALTLWVIITPGDETANLLRVLSKHTSAGADEYKMETASDYQKTLPTTNTKLRYDFDLDNNTPFVQVQTQIQIQEAKTTSTTTTTTTPGFSRATISIVYTLGYK